MKKAHEAGLQVWPAVDNFNHPDGLSGFSTGSYFRSEKNRADFIARLMADAEKYGFDGYNLDFEGIRASAGRSYVQFIRDLSLECRKNGLILSVDNYVPHSYNEFYDIEEQGIYADYVVIMGYDEHTKGSDAGSVASIGYTEYAIAEALSAVHAEKLIHGVPFYTRVWKEENGKTSSKLFGMKQLEEVLSEYGLKLEWDKESGQYYGERSEGGVTYRFWAEDARSMEEKVSLIRKNDLAGVAAWRLDDEPAEIWSVIDLNGGGKEPAGADGNKTVDTQ